MGIQVPIKDEKRVGYSICDAVGSLLLSVISLYRTSRQVLDTSTYRIVGWMLMIWTEQNIAEHRVARNFPVAKRHSPVVLL